MLTVAIVAVEAESATENSRAQIVVLRFYLPFRSSVGSAK
jgi:hypothetical protein